MQRYDFSSKPANNPERKVRIALQLGEDGFSSFLIFSLGRNAVFAIFRSSSVDETQNSLFSARYPWMKRSFYCFSLVIRGWKSVFSVFWWKPWAVLPPEAYFCKKRWQVLLPDGPHSMSAWGMLPSSTSICNPLLIIVTLLFINYKKCVYVE